jgi:hypothetical protein
MIDRPHVENILEISEGALDAREFFAEPHGVDGGQVRLLGLDDILALVGLLAVKSTGCSKKRNTPSSLAQP